MFTPLIYVKSPIHILQGVSMECDKYAHQFTREDSCRSIYKYF